MCGAGGPNAPRDGRMTDGGARISAGCGLVRAASTSGRGCSLVPRVAVQLPQAPAKGEVDPALDLGELELLGRRGLGQAEGGGAGDQSAKDGVEGVVRFDAGLAGTGLPAEPGRRRLQRREQAFASCEVGLVAIARQSPEEERRGGIGLEDAVGAGAIEAMRER